MIKRTIYLGNPCKIRTQDNQLIVNYSFQVGDKKYVPLEDIGILVIDNPQITLSQNLITGLLKNNTAILSCDQAHLPFGLMLPIYGNKTHTEIIRYQVKTSVPLTKNLWQQTVISKINNQAELLKLCHLPYEKMNYWSNSVRSGDPDNYESRAAAYYWEILFDNFKRHRFGYPPNNLLNYGYAILRAVVARSLVVSGLAPSLGIHHRNKYNPFCLADDVMEPYRPFVDYVVYNIISSEKNIEELNADIKRKLLSIPAIDVEIEKKKCPLMISVQRTTSSLVRCYQKEQRKILYPKFLT